MRPKIYLFGDSITEQSFDDGGWGAALANHFSRTVDVVLRGYSGYNTRWAFKVFDRVFPAAETGGSEGAAPPLAVTVFFGANDACLPDGYAAFQHVPVDEYKRNLHSIVSSLKNRWPKTLVILIAPPPIDEDERLRHPYAENPSGLPERTNEAAGVFAKACVEAAGECGIPVVDLWTRMQQYPEWRKAFLSDGLHLTPEGNKVVFKEVMKKLNEGGISLGKLEVDLPVLADIDHADPLKAFQ
ncbi:Guard-cell-enriched GDSL Lipase 28 [Hibiscus trionum]|uniref:Guard-cell-enriched GDSL Lipase 28 n=1 Tax=Hibiscus trionum TaxID=183268 RepID=A0A9W7MTI1_HIBTR|nr:Guard-cell-enriched GDSL Lipase 28 [Hibiscus trionum]